MPFRIKNWRDFQHYQRRRPPWIKIHREILEDPDWHNLSPQAAKTLIMLWLIASEDKTMNGTLPSEKKLAFRLRLSESQLCQTLEELDHWIIKDLPS